MVSGAQAQLLEVGTRVWGKDEAQAAEISEERGWEEGAVLLQPGQAGGRAAGLWVEVPRRLGAEEERMALPPEQP